MRATVDGETVDVRAVWFRDGAVRMIDQRELPDRLVFADFTDYRGVAGAIRDMTVRGAPSIGASAAYAMCLAALAGCDLEAAAADIKSARPTAYDLFHAVDWMEARLAQGRDPVEAADEYAQSTVDKCLMIGRHGADLIEDGMRIMTHCNAGALATVDVGTALAPMRVAHDQGKRFMVYVSETRPRLQGMQLTAWELGQEGIDHRIVPDGSSAHFMSQGVDLVITGADRIAANGDFANKIGTLDKAIAAKHYGVPFYVAAPASTFDPSARSGKDIVIEERDEDEVRVIAGRRMSPEGSRALNPAFDVTPAELVTGFVTERGVLKPDEIGVMGDRDGRVRIRAGRMAGPLLRHAVREGADGVRRGEHERAHGQRHPDHPERQEQGAPRPRRDDLGGHGRHGGLRREALDRDRPPPGAVRGEPQGQRGAPLPPAELRGPHAGRPGAPVQRHPRGGAAPREGCQDPVPHARLPGAGRRREGQLVLGGDDTRQTRGDNPGRGPGGGVQQDGGAGVPGPPVHHVPRRGGPPRVRTEEAGGAPTAILVTKWFGSFLLDEKSGKVLREALMPKDAAAVAVKLAAMQRGEVLDEERALVEGVEKPLVADRRQSPVGKPAVFDSSFIKASDYGFDDAFMHEAMLGLARLRTSEPVPRDRNLAMAIRSLDDQIAAANVYSERLHEWYGMHFPELADHVRDRRYAELVAGFGEREAVKRELGLDIESIGADMDAADVRAMSELAAALCRTYGDIDRTEAYIQGIVEECCPNMCALLGGPLAARLVSLAGGLERLASLPSSTVQLLGAEKAMFRSMRSGKRGPKHGVLYQHPDVHRAPYWQRGKIARALAGKTLTAAKIDQYRGEFAGDRLNAEFHARVEEIRRQYPDPPKKSQKPKGGSRPAGKPQARGKRVRRRACARYS